MVTTFATLLISSMAGGGFITPQHAIAANGFVWSMADVFHEPMKTPHPQGARVVAAAGDASSSAYILAHDRNVEILIYGTGGNGMSSFNETDAPKDLRTAGALKMWSLGGGRYFVQSDSKGLAWVFDSVRYWAPTDYLPGLKNLDAYNGGIATLMKKPTPPKDVPPPAEPAKVAQQKNDKPKKVARFAYRPITSEQDLGFFHVESPDLSDVMVEVELPEGASPVTGFVPVATPGYVVLRSGTKGLVYSVADQSLTGEVALGNAPGTLVVDSGQVYSLSFGGGGRPQVARLELTPTKAQH